MPKKTRHENSYIALSLLFYAAVVAGIFFIPWAWYVKVPVLIGAALVYECALRLIVKIYK